MSTATNVTAVAVNTISWLSGPDVSIVVPVYQRQYRWDIGSCEQLLADIRSVADEHDRHTHFVGSILSSASAETPGELILIDGQQRLTTTMLLLAALHHIARDAGSELADELHRALVRPDAPDRTKLRPHAAWADAFEAVVLDRERTSVDATTRFDDNYAFFRSQIRPDDVARIWRGLRRLEHVAITLGADANAQQIFESLNSTGEPLRDHELIHNYILMGLGHPEQRALEEGAWLPIERNTGDALADFWRHYLIMRTGREIQSGANREVYEAFRAEFPRLDDGSLDRLAQEWRAASEVYRVLREPSLAANPRVTQHLAYANTFGREMYPLLLQAYDDLRCGRASVETFVEGVEDLQSLQLRRLIVGLDTANLVARLCRARHHGAPALAAAISRIMPSDERVRVGLKFAPLPHPAYVLERLGGAGGVLEWIAPLAPGDAWTGDGQRTWADLEDDEQNSLRALTETLGNLTLLEPELIDEADGRSFPDKRALYARSALALSRELGQVERWDTAAITARTRRLSDDVVDVWRRRRHGAIDDDGLTPILDARRRRGWPVGWQREFAYVEYRGEHWEIYDMRALFARIFARLWAEDRRVVEDFSAERGGPVFDSRAWNGRWEPLADGRWLYTGWDSRYMLAALQSLLDRAGIASEVFLKYSHIGDAME